MADDASFLPGLSPVAGKPVPISFDAGRLSADGRVLVLAEIERHLGTSAWPTASRIRARPSAPSTRSPR
jgi:hypothetical protein